MSKTRVMLVDDSVVVRGLLRRIVSREEDMEVVATCTDGESAVQQYMSVRPDVVLMDIEMPKLDGIGAVKQILAQDADARIIMCSSQTHTGAEMTFRALEAGALDYLGKPSSETLENGRSFDEMLVRKIRTLRKLPSRPAAPAVKPAAAPEAPLRHISPSVIAIGASTGGPKALGQLLSLWEGAPECPVLITQHIPMGFTGQLAANLQRICSLPVCEAKDGMPLENGHVYIAPGGQHLTVEQGRQPAVLLSDAPPLNFCRPSVDMMLLSLGMIYQSRILTIILTGMGEDGRAGCNTLKHQSQDNLVLVQDEASSVVWGMPGAVAKAGAADAVLPIEGIARHVNRMIRKQRVS